MESLSVPIGGNKMPQRKPIKSKGKTYKHVGMVWDYHGVRKLRRENRKAGMDIIARKSPKGHFFIYRRRK